MAISSSGSVSFSQIQSEFGGSNPIGISEYYNADPHKPTPSSGQVDLNSFRGSSGRTAKIISGKTNESVPLCGYTSANGGYYHAQYGGKSGAAIGSTTKTTGLISGRTLAGLVAFRDADVVNSWVSSTRSLIILQRGSGNSGWASVNIKIGVSSWTLNRSSATSYYSPGSGMSPSGSWWRFSSSSSGSAPYQIHASLVTSGRTVLIRFD